MFSEQDEKYLIRLLGRNDVILFLGAGFSLDSTNRLGENFPTGWELGEKLWSFLGFEQEYDGTSLSLMYQHFVDIGVKRSSKVDFLNNTLLSNEIPDYYNSVTIPYWHKIYSINIDDVIQKIFLRQNKKINEVIYPFDEFKERDQSLERTSVIHLHGKLPCNPEDVIFSAKQYAKAGLTNQPLYSQFVYDYATRPTIFIGTDLNEPIFERYIEARENKDGYGESRPKSFLITPKLSPVKAALLKNSYNVHHIEAKGEEFLNWLKSIQRELPTRQDILRTTFPSLLDITDFIDSSVSKKSIYQFSSSFKRVPTEYRPKRERSMYLQGSNPTWNDIHLNMDIPRTITTPIYSEVMDSLKNVEENSLQKIITLSGTAGSGKSTIIKRLGLNLSRNGVTVFISDSDIMPKSHQIFDVLDSIKEQVVLIFDNASLMLGYVNKLIPQFAQLEHPPILILSVRSNQINRINSIIDPNIINHTHFRVPNLDMAEIPLLIDKLDEFNLLSRLKGMSTTQRINEFKNKAKKQILVAMKEVTNGLPFDEIIKDEFNCIHSHEAKTLCVCVALNTELGFYNTKQDFVGFSSVSHNEALDYLNNTLEGTFSYLGEKRDKIMVRHRILADYIISHCASLMMLKDAYIRVLSVLAPELVNTSSYTRKFNLYKSLINHKKIFLRFKEDMESAREVYDSLKSYFEYEPHFWLQYASLEMEGHSGDLKLAENYIHQAESLSPNSDFIQNAKCNLFYKLSTSDIPYSYALEYKRTADELAEELISRIGDNEPYIYHIHCRGRYYFIQRWVTNYEEKKSQIKELRKDITNAGRKHPRDRKLEQASQAINRAYMIMGASGNIEQPDIL
ncbi:hypothetical protein IL45_04670 [Nonlabens ulvanivorans]|uniref:AAA+ ATPase domain-containing protein n=1 Tax=Nonlabens ulvanivorans TaxID=906888 RepID=A0A084JX28_NONUL|nr:SIR2 family protein [Nonlabens ulvanivorans]KEZ93512.1 hypothetical protein IL45_04670 [Nonlabens ulvanivorans]